MASSKFNAVVQFGGSVANSLGSAVKSTKGRLGQINTSIRETKTEQKQLNLQIKEMKRAGKDVSHLEARYEDLNRTLADLTRQQKRWQRIAQSSTNVGNKFGTMTQQVGSLSRKAALGVGAFGASIFGVANSTADLGDNAAKTADKIGLSVEALQELRYSAARSGVSTGKFDSSIERFSKRIGEATLGSGAAKKAYEELGLSADDLSKMLPDEALGVVANRLMEVENQSQRTAYAAMLFGREGVGMVNMLKGGSDGLEQLREEARATGNVLSETTAREGEVFKDVLEDTTWIVGGLKNMLGSELQPVVIGVMREFNAWIKDNRDEVKEFAKTFVTGLKDTLPAIGNAIKGLSKIVGAIGSATKTVANMVGGFDNLGMIIGTIFAGKAIMSVFAFGSSIYGLALSLGGLSSIMPMVATGIKAIGMAIMANPIGILIGAVAGAAFLIYKYWEPISGFFSDLWGGVKSVFGSVWNFIKSLFGWTPLGALIENWTPISEFFSGLWDSVKSTVSIGWEVIKSLFGWTPLGAIAENWEPISDFFTNLWGGLVDGAKAAFDWIAGKLSWAGDAISSISGFFGFGDDEEEKESPNQRARARATESINAASAQVVNRNSSNSDTKIEININGSDKSPKEIAMEVSAELARMKRKEQGARMYD